MGILEELGLDAIGEVHLPQDGWQAIALQMIENRRKQVTNAFRRAKTERQEEALTAELKRMAELEYYVHMCQVLARRENDLKSMATRQEEVSVSDEVTKLS